MRVSPFLLALLFTAGCVPQAPHPAAPPPQAPPLPPAPAAAPSADWRDQPLTPGTWSYRQDARGSTARFGATPAAARLTLRCDAAARQVVLTVRGAMPGMLTVRTTSTARALAAQPAADTPAAAAATLTADDPLLDAMGFSRGRFAVEQAGTPLLAVPAWAEIERVTEDCRG